MSKFLLVQLVPPFVDWFSLSSLCVESYPEILSVLYMPVFPFTWEFLVFWSMNFSELFRVGFSDLYHFPLLFFLRLPILAALISFLSCSFSFSFEFLSLLAFVFSHHPTVSLLSISRDMNLVVLMSPLFWSFSFVRPSVLGERRWLPIENRRWSKEWNTAAVGNSECWLYWSLWYVKCWMLDMVARLLTGRSMIFIFFGRGEDVYVEFLSIGIRW